MNWEHRFYAAQLIGGRSTVFRICAFVLSRYHAMYRLISYVFF